MPNPNIHLPYSSEFVTVTVLGKYTLLNPANNSELLPVGFRSTRRFYSLKNPSKIIAYHNEIIDGGNSLGPIFKVWNNEGFCLHEGSSDTAWHIILQRIAKLKNEEPPYSVDGAAAFGYSLPCVTAAVKELPFRERHYRKSKKKFPAKGSLRQSSWHPACVGYAIYDSIPTLDSPSKISPVFMGRRWIFCFFCSFCHLPGRFESFHFSKDQKKKLIEMNNAFFQKSSIVNTLCPSKEYCSQAKMWECYNLPLQEYSLPILDDTRMNFRKMVEAALQSQKIQENFDVKSLVVHKKLLLHENCLKIYQKNIKTQMKTEKALLGK